MSENLKIKATKPELEARILTTDGQTKNSGGCCRGGSLPSTLCPHTVGNYFIHKTMKIAEENENSRRKWIKSEQISKQEINKKEATREIWHDPCVRGGDGLVAAGRSLDSGSHPIKLFIEIHILEFIKSIRAETLARIGIIMKDESRSFLSLP